MKTSIKQSLTSGAKGWLPALLVVVALTLSGVTPAWADNDRHDPRDRDRDRDRHDDEVEIVRPDERYLGKTYGQWAAAWWQWALSIPAAQNPLTDTTGEFAGVGQSGPVWFLAGTLGNSAERTVTVPAGKPIFVAVHQWIFGSSVFDCDPTVPGVPCDVPTLRQAAAAAATGAEVVEAWIDGEKVRHIRSYRGISPEPFSVTLPDDSIIGIPAGTYFPQVSDGYWLMLEPLSKGKHTIRVHVVNSAFNTDMNLVIHINVVKPVKIVPPNEEFEGRSYAEWSAKWWEWLLEYPINDPKHPHPALNPDFDVKAFQDFDDVWFLSGTFGTTDVTLTVPSGKALFFPVLNVEASSLEASPYYGGTAAEQRAKAKFHADHIVNPAFTIDGRAIGPMSAYRVTSPQFKFDAPTPWIFGAPPNFTGGKGTAVGDGYYILIEPLPKGEHTLHFTGKFHFEAGEVPEFGSGPADFPVDATLHLKVK